MPDRKKVISRCRKAIDSGEPVMDYLFYHEIISLLECREDVAPNTETHLPRRKVEFIESYVTGGEFGSDYQWDDNHGELIRCKDCKYYQPEEQDCLAKAGYFRAKPDWYCADGKRGEKD